MKEKSSILDSFPKVRNPLPKDYQEIYEKHFKSNREGTTSASSITQKMEAWMHRKVAKDLKSDNPETYTLEIGAGNLNQLPYEFKTRYDIVEPYIDFYKNSPLKDRVSSFFTDISEIQGRQYDRITSIATFEHITNLPFVVAKSCLLLKENGALRVAIPNEGTILWKMGWMFTTGLEFKIKYKKKYSTLLKNEHVNTAKEIDQVLKLFFGKVRVKVFGLGRHLGFYRYYECRLPDLNMAEDYINKNSEL